MKYIFGPVNSRRLGLSLGIDLVPYKTCTLNCIYCECGETSNLTSRIDEYVPTDGVIAELSEYLSVRPTLDVLTFSGSGEPTLHSGIKRIITFLKESYSEYRVALLTNGTLFYNKDVRESVLGADIIIPSIDAISEGVFDKITRPISGIDVKTVINGLIELRKEYCGEIILEIFIVPGINDRRSEIEGIRDACLRIRPDRIHLNTLDRPGSEEWIEAATIDSLQEIKYNLAPLVVEIVGSQDAYKDHCKQADDIQCRASSVQHVHRHSVLNNDEIDVGLKEVSKAVLSTIERRPSTLNDLSIILGIEKPKLTESLQYLLINDKIEERSTKRGSFYRLKRVGFN
ncbi:MAG: radical SAM protein [Spirochaetota bacterium]|nr:radical SAM protein [Spirochaetota bacterium]